MPDDRYRYPRYRQRCQIGHHYSFTQSPTYPMHSTPVYHNVPEERQRLLINPPLATATNASHPEIPAPRPPLLWISFRPLSTSSIIRIYIHQQQWHPYYVNSHGSLLPSLDLPLPPHPYRVDSLLPLFEKLEVDHLNCWVLVPSPERFPPSKLNEARR